MSSKAERSEPMTIKAKIWYSSRHDDASTVDIELHNETFQRFVSTLYDNPQGLFLDSKKAKEEGFDGQVFIPLHRINFIEEIREGGDERQSG